MKIYKFFKIPDEDDNNGCLEERYPLYAITNNKDLANRFKHDRNMKKFICKTHKHITKEEYAEMCNEDRGSVLELYEAITIFKNQHTKKNSTKTNILITYYERQMIEEMDSYLADESFWRQMPYPLIFKNRYVKMLDVFQYLTYYKLMTAEYLPYRWAKKLSNEDDDYSAPSIVFDDVAKFISIISDTL